MYPEPLDHDRQEQEAKGDHDGAKTEADNSLYPRDGELGILGQWGTGEKAYRQEGQSRPGMLVSDHSSCSPILVPPLEMQYLFEPYLAHYVTTKAKEKC